MLASRLLSIQQSPTLSQVDFFEGPDNGSWHVNRSWSRGYFPGISDEARIYNGTTVTMGADVTVGQVVVGFKSNGHMVQNAGHLNAGSLQVGMWDADAYAGAYTLNGGSVGVGAFMVGLSDGDNIFTMNGGDVVTEYRFWIGGFYTNADAPR